MLVLFQKNGSICKEIFDHSGMIFTNINSFKTYNFIHTDIEIKYFGISLLKKYFCSRIAKKAYFLANCTKNTVLKTGLYEILIPNLDVFSSEAKFGAHDSSQLN
jgi:hypothetical protein